MAINRQNSSQKKTKKFDKEKIFFSDKQGVY